MGNYISAAQLEQRVGAVRYANLCGVTGGELDTLVTAIIGRAESIIDAFAAARFSVPLTPTDLVAEWALCLAEYELYKRGAGASVPEKIRDSYKDTVGQLSDLSAGRLEIPSATKPAPANTAGASIVVSGAANLFDAESMDPF